jgi:hypothetical protein
MHDGLSSGGTCGRRRVRRQRRRQRRRAGKSKRERKRESERVREKSQSACARGSVESSKSFESKCRVRFHHEQSALTKHNG